MGIILDEIRNVYPIRNGVIIIDDPEKMEKILTDNGMKTIGGSLPQNKQQNKEMEALQMAPRKNP